MDLPEDNSLAKHYNYSTANYTGFSVHTFQNNLLPQFARDYSVDGWPLADFAGVFGVLFSGVTGIMAGANMSGTIMFPVSSTFKISRTVFQMFASYWNYECVVDLPGLSDL